MGDLPTMAMDVVSILQAATQRVFDNAQAVMEGSNSIEAGFDNALQALVSTSYQIGLPTLYGGTSEDAVTTRTNPLPVFADYESWDNISCTSTRTVTEENLKTTKDAVAELIAQSGMSERAKIVAERMLEKSVDFAEKLFSFKDRFYNELKNTYQTDEKEAWYLAAKL